MRRRGGATALMLAVLGSFMLALATLAQQGGPARALANCTTSGATIDSEEQAFLGLINSYRASNGLGSLSISSSLSAAAAWLSNDLGTKAYFSHTDSLGRSPSARAADCGYTAGAGENIAGGTAWGSAQAVFDGWKASPGHNANMLTSYYRVIGIGRANVPGSPYGWYWTTDFGTVDDSGAPPPTTAPATPPTSTPTPAVTTAPTSAPTLTPTATPTSTPTGAAATNTPTPAAGSATATATPFAPTSTSTATPAATGGTASATPTRTPTSVPESGGATKTPAPAPEAAALIPLASGANLIAWGTTDRTPAEAFGAAGNTIAMVYSWDPATGSWRRYGPGLPAFLNNLTMFRTGEAYWVIAKVAGSVAIGR